MGNLGGGFACRQQQLFSFFDSDFQYIGSWRFSRIFSKHFLQIMRVDPQLFSDRIQGESLMIMSVYPVSRLGDDFLLCSQPGFIIRPAPFARTEPLAFGLFFRTEEHYMLSLR